MLFEEDKYAKRPQMLFLESNQPVNLIFCTLYVDKNFCSLGAIAKFVVALMTFILYL